MKALGDSYQDNASTLASALQTRPILAKFVEDESKTYNMVASRDVLRAGMVILVDDPVINDDTFKDLALPYTDEVCFPEDCIGLDGRCAFIVEGIKGFYASALTEVVCKIVFENYQSGKGGESQAIIKCRSQNSSTTACSPNESERGSRSGKSASNGEEGLEGETSAEEPYTVPKIEEVFSDDESDETPSPHSAFDYKSAVKRSKTLTSLQILLNKNNFFKNFAQKVLLSDEEIRDIDYDSIEKEPHTKFEDAGAAVTDPLADMPVRNSTPATSSTNQFQPLRRSSAGFGSFHREPDFTTGYSVPLGQSTLINPADGNADYDIDPLRPISLVDLAKRIYNGIGNSHAALGSVEATMEQGMRPMYKKFVSLEKIVRLLEVIRNLYSLDSALNDKWVSRPINVDTHPHGEGVNFYGLSAVVKHSETPNCFIAERSFRINDPRFGGTKKDSQGTSPFFPTDIDVETYVKDSIFSNCMQESGPLGKEGTEDVESFVNSVKATGRGVMNKFNRNTIHLRSLRPLKKGEPITVDFSGYPDSYIGIQKILPTTKRLPDGCIPDRLRCHICPNCGSEEMCFIYKPILDSDGEPAVALVDPRKPLPDDLLSNASTAEHINFPAFRCLDCGHDADLEYARECASVEERFIELMEVVDWNDEDNCYGPTIFKPFLNNDTNLTPVGTPNPLAAINKCGDLLVKPRGQSGGLLNPERDGEPDSFMNQDRDRLNGNCTEEEREDEGDPFEENSDEDIESYHPIGRLHYLVFQTAWQCWHREILNENNPFPRRVVEFIAHVCIDGIKRHTGMQHHPDMIRFYRVLQLLAANEQSHLNTTYVNEKRANRGRGSGRGRIGDTERSDGQGDDEDITNPNSDSRNRFIRGASAMQIQAAFEKQRKYIEEEHKIVTTFYPEEGIKQELESISMFQKNSVVKKQMAETFGKFPQ